MSPLGKVVRNQKKGEFCTNTLASLHFLHNQIILCGFVRAKSHPPRNFFREKKGIN